MTTDQKSPEAVLKEWENQTSDDDIIDMNCSLAEALRRAIKERDDAARIAFVANTQAVLYLNERDSLRDKLSAALWDFEELLGQATAHPDDLNIEWVAAYSKEAISRIKETP